MNNKRVGSNWGIDSQFITTWLVYAHFHLKVKKEVQKSNKLEIKIQVYWTTV